MQGVPYPVQGIDDTGHSQMMYPGMDYTFPGNTVTEYPMALYGGDPTRTVMTGHYQNGGGWLDSSSLPYAQEGLSATPTYQGGKEQNVSYTNNAGKKILAKAKAAAEADRQYNFGKALLNATSFVPHPVIGTAANLMAGSLDMTEGEHVPGALQWAEAALRNDPKIQALKGFNNLMTGKDLYNFGTSPTEVYNNYLPYYTNEQKREMFKPQSLTSQKYGGDPSLSDITGHYPFGGQNTKTHTHMKGGGSLNRKVTCSNCGWSWKLVDGGTDPMTCHKCGGTIKMQTGGWLDKYQDAGPVLPYKPSTTEEYNFRNKMYNDSLALANQSRKIDWAFPKNPNISKEEYDKLKELEDSYPQYHFLKEQYDIDKKKKTVGEFKDYIQQYYLTNSLSSNGVISRLKDDEKKSITGKDLSEGIDLINKKYEEATNKYSKEWVDKKGLNYSFQPDSDDDKSGFLDIYDSQTGTTITKFVYKDHPEYNSTINISNKYIKPTETLYKGNKDKRKYSEIGLSSKSTGWYDSSKGKPTFKDKTNDKYISYTHDAEERNLYPFPKQKILKPDKDAPEGEELTMELFLKDKEKKKKEKEEKEKKENKKPKKQALPTGVKRQWNFNGPNPVMEYYDKAGKLTNKEYYTNPGSSGKKIEVANKKYGGWLDSMQVGGTRFGDLRPTTDASRVFIPNLPKEKLTKAEKEEAKKYEKLATARSLQEAQKKVAKINRINAANKAQETQGFPTTRQEWADQTQALGDKLSLQNLPVVGKYVPDILDVTGDIGSMASSLGSAPLRAQQENSYIPYLDALSGPLLTGALAGVGTKNTKQFVNNIVNPFGEIKLKGNNKTKGLISRDKDMPLALSSNNPRMLNPGVSNELPPIPSELILPTHTPSPWQQVPIADDVFDGIKNRSGLSKDEALAKAAAKDKDLLSKMSDEEFKKTVLKPTGEVVSYKPGPEIEQMGYNMALKDMQLNNAIPMSYQDYVDIFNSRLDLLNEIITRNNKTGIKYHVQELNPNGQLIFSNPAQVLPGVNPNMPEHYKKLYGHLPSGTSTWDVSINPGEWAGDIEDIANTEYFKSIPGIGIHNSASGVFADKVARRGTGTYESLNEYLKKLDLGRVKSGFNSQTDQSKGLWENAIHKGNAFGFYNDKSGVIHGAMRQEGGQENDPNEEYRRGGQKGLKKYTSKNIQSSVNDLFMRNETLFGPAGKKHYRPGLKYKSGGNWLDNLH
jgi:ribosomal protein S27E